MTDIVFRLQALIPATQDMDSTDAAETIEEACGEIFKLRGLLAEARRERDEARAEALEEAAQCVENSAATWLPNVAFQVRSLKGRAQ